MSDSGRTTYLVISDLSGAAAAAVRFVWQNLEARFGITGAQTEPAPRVIFSVFQAAREQEAAIVAALTEAAPTIHPFSMFLDGVSSDEGPLPEVFLRVIKGGEAGGVFNAIFRAISAVKLKVEPAFQPGAWLPNCMLAKGDLKPDQVHAVRNYLRTQVLKWRTPVKEIHLLRVDGALVERVETWPLGEQTPAETPHSFWK